MQKKLISVLILLIIGAGVFYFTRNTSQKLKPLPTKDNSSPSGLYADVPPFKEWEWMEEKDEEENVVYRIKLPGNDKYIKDLINNYDFINNIDHGILLRDNQFSEGLINNRGLNIDEFVKNNEGFFYRKWTNYPRQNNLGKYFVFSSDDLFYDIFHRYYYILTSNYLFIFSVDYDERCINNLQNIISKKSLEIDKNKCQEYFQIYFPIVEKALSTLEIPDYLDNRGFAPEELWDIKLLPDELRIYEVR